METGDNLLLLNSDAKVAALVFVQIATPAPNKRLIRSLDSGLR